MALISRFLRDFGFLLSVVAADVVDVSSVFTLVLSLFSTLFASVDGTSVFFSADFSSVAETVGDSTDGALASVDVGVLVSS